MALQMTTDLLGDLAPRSKEVREKIIQEVNKIDESYQHLAQLLHECYENTYYIRWGYSNFKEYCESEGLHYRRSKYLVGIAQVVKDMGIPWEDIEGVGWTKMRSLIPILKEQGEIGDWLELAKMHTVKELDKLVADSKIGLDIGAIGGDRIVELKFKLTPTTAEIVLDALDHAKRVAETEDPVLALEQMSYDYVMQQGGDPERTSLERLIQFAERSYGVELVVADREGVAEMMDNLDKQQEVSVGKE
jgi:hypothetical protein